MQIKILGTGCCNCQNLEENTRKALSELKMDAQVEKVTDMAQIMNYGIMSLPAIIADEKVLSYGSVPSVEEIKKILTENKLPREKSSGKCSCNCDCR